MCTASSTRIEKGLHFHAAEVDSYQSWSLPKDAVTKEENVGLGYHGSRRQAGQGNVTFKLTIDHHDVYVGGFLPQASAFIERMNDPNTIFMT